MQGTNARRNPSIAYNHLPLSSDDAARRPYSLHASDAPRRGGGASVGCRAMRPYNLRPPLETGWGLGGLVRQTSA
ncbi:MAG: hypothetical protein ACLQVM_11660 [Terriglobia bacterium]